MTKFAKFDRKNLTNLRAEMEAVLQKYGVDSNLEFEVGSMRFSDAEVTIKVTAKLKGARTMTDIILQSRVEALGLVMEKNGCKLVRYDTKKHKYPFIYEKDGKLYQTSTEHAKFLFAA
jgi:hypothetical protein